MVDQNLKKKKINYITMLEFSISVVISGFAHMIIQGMFLPSFGNTELLSWFALNV